MPTATTARLSDGVKTLGSSPSPGLNIEADVTARRIRELCETYQLKRDGRELFRFLPLPTPGAKIHLFTEALVRIAHLGYLHEPAAQTLNVARQTMENVFRERQIDAKTNQILAGKVEKRIRVDCPRHALPLSRSASVGPSRRSDELHGTMGLALARSARRPPAPPPCHALRSRRARHRLHRKRHRLSRLRLLRPLR